VPRWDNDLKSTAGCQISILIFENKLWRRVSINIPSIYIKDDKVLAHFWLAVLDIFFMGYS
jgi:hypothetical protein